MIFSISQIVSLFLFSILVTSFFKSRALGFILSLLFSLILTGELVSIFLEGMVINYKAYIPSSFKNLIISLNFFLSEFLQIAFFFTLFLVFIYKLSNQLNSVYPPSKTGKLVMGFISFSYLFLSGGVANHIGNAVQIIQAPPFQLFENIQATTSSNDSTLNPIEATNQGEKVWRVIAHGGGTIDNHFSTNSLEALNLSYKNGYKLFELDILKTSDNFYVAAHDWEDWANQTGFQGELPPTRQVFMQTKIQGKYTPLDMVGINDWFLHHPDAILITDKVNEPTKFTEKFIDSKRLMMELFTMKTVEEGTKTDMKSVMASERVIKRIIGNQTNKLKEIGVRDVVVCLQFAESFSFILEDFKRNGIRTWIYNLNVKEAKDEEKVIENGLEYINGLYSDYQWSFN